LDENSVENGIEPSAWSDEGRPSIWSFLFVGEEENVFIHGVLWGSYLQEGYRRSVWTRQPAVCTCWTIDNHQHLLGERGK
jgi:hypothetical protein